MMRLRAFLVVTCALALLGAGCVEGEDGGAWELAGESNGKDSKKGSNEEKAPSGSSGSDGIQRSGSRLRMRSYVASDGAKQFIGWWDTNTQENCGAATAEDGRLRCLPVIYGRLIFSDADCYGEVIEVVTGSNEATPGLVRDLGGTNSSYSVYSPGSEYTGQDVYIRSGTACIQSQRAESFTYYHATKVPPTTFIEFTETIH